MMRSSVARCCAAASPTSAASSIPPAAVIRDERTTMPQASVSILPMSSTVLPSALDALSERLSGSRVRAGVPLAPFTTFRIGGPADLLYEATTADELAHAVLAARELGVPYFVLGLGANILIGDRGVRGLVIRNVADHFTFGDDGTLWVESGATMRR